MEIQGYFTKKGLALLTKLATGATLTITRVVAGSGQTADPATAIALPQIKQTLAVNTPEHKGTTATIPVTLTAALAAADYTLTELGVYARDPDEGEILYKLYKIETPVMITAGSRLVLRFYLEETASQDLNVTVACSPAGLITEESFLPIQEKVLAKKPITTNYTMDITQVQTFLDSLPRLLTENISISVSGTLEERLKISGFYGGGSITIRAEERGGCVFHKGAYIESGANIYVTNCTFSNPDLSTNSESEVVAGDVRLLMCTDCDFEGNAVGSALSASYNTLLKATGCTFTNYYSVIIANSGARVFIDCTMETDTSNNRLGAWVWHGGTIIMGPQTHPTLGGSANKKDGGFIVKPDGTLS